MLQAQIFIDLEDMKGDQSLHDYLIKFLAERNIAGATSFLGYAGFGKHHKIKNPRELFSFDEPPAMIMFIDEVEKVRKIVAELKIVIPGKVIFLLNAERA
ncbi:MAG: DUF190 domain-containing protein [Chryseolinea sp.]